MLKLNKRNSKFLKILAPLLVVNFLWTIVYYTNKDFFTTSANNLLLQFQNARNNSTLHRYATVNVFLASSGFTMFLIPFLYLSVRPLVGVRTFFLVMTSLWVCSLFQIFHREPTPLSSESTETCAQFAYPSLNSFFAASVYSFFVLFFTNNKWRAIAALCSLLFWISTAFSLTILGNNTYPQIIDGGLLGLLTLGLYRYSEAWVIKPVKIILKKTFPMQIVLWSAVGVGLLIPTLSVWGIVVSSSSMHSEWDSFLNEKCKDSILQLRQPLSISFAATFSVLGCGYGISLVAKTLLPLWYESKWWKRLLRYVMNVPILVLLMYSFDMWLPEEPFVSVLLLRFSFRFFISVFITCGVIPWISGKVNLVNSYTFKEGHIEVQHFCEGNPELVKRDAVKLTNELG